MCRLFASIRVKDVPMDRSTVLRAFFAQSRLHPDGWGMARFLDDGPRVVKEPVEASKSLDLPRYLSWGNEPLFLAHIRQSSVGGNTMENTHPFLHHGWAFGHNGTIDLPNRIKANLTPASSSELQGSTDSEALFMLLVQNMEEAGDPVQGIADTVRAVHEIRGPKTTALNFIMSQGRSLYILNSAFVRADYYAMHYLVDADGKGMVFSSKPLDQEKGWTRMEKHTLMVVDRELKVERRRMA